MVAIGSKGLPRRKPLTSNLTEDIYMAGEDNSHGRHSKKRNMGRKSTKKNSDSGRDYSAKNHAGGASDNGRNVSNNKYPSTQEESFLRKQVDPDTAKYFSEIANAIESPDIDAEERSVICGNALEESVGKEVELATDYVLSHTMESLLVGCDVGHICDFLQNCSKTLPRIAMDRSGSHVAESALKSLSSHLEDSENWSIIEDTLHMICQVIVDNPVEMMCNSYGSHVIRSLLCFCKGEPLGSSEFHVTKSSTILAKRLNLKPSQPERNDPQHLQHGFPNQLEFLISGILAGAKKEIGTLQTDQYGSLVLQAALEKLAGDEQKLLHIIPIILGCNPENPVEGNFIESTSARGLLKLMKEPAFSRLMEVIFDVAPEILYDEIFTKVFKDSLFQMSCHPCGNFVIQALVSHARSDSHMQLIWEQLGQKFEELLGMGKSGVVASVIAASQKLHSHEKKCSEALAAAVCLENESSKPVVPRILFLESYFNCADRSKWNWPCRVKMHVMGSLILQSIFKFPTEHIQPYITSITSMEAEHILETSKDSGGQRVVEAFLSSNASGKQKRRLVVKLKGHFGELAMHQSGFFIVDKCFSTSNISLRETIVSELSNVQAELYKTRRGPFLMRKLDVDGFTRRPDQWRTRQTSKESAYQDFYATFGSQEAKPSSKASGFLAEALRSSQPEKIKDMRKEIEASFASPAAPTQFLASKDSGHKRRPKEAKQHSQASKKHGADGDDDASRSERKKAKKKQKTEDEVVPDQKKEKKRRKKDESSPVAAKKQKSMKFA